MPEIGKVLENRYRILRKIGEGGMGAVFEAEHLGLRKRVAVKVLKQEYVSNRDVMERFQREGLASCRITHPNIVDVFDIGTAGAEEPYLVMEFLQGESLADALKREGKLPLHRTVEILSQVLSALSRAHEAGIIHRDIKPENVFLVRLGTGKDFVKILDFGIAKVLEGNITGQKLTQTGSLLGTPHFLSPEQAKGDTDIDHRVDLYAVGVMAYQMVSGDLPFSGGNLLQIIQRIIAERPVPLLQLAPDLPPAFAGLIDKAMDKERERRPTDAQAFLFALNNAMGRDSVRPASIEMKAAVPTPYVSPAEVVRAKPAEPETVRDRPASPPPKKPMVVKAGKPTPLTTATETPTHWSQAVIPGKRSLIPTAVVAVAVLGALAALLFFGKSRQQEEPSIAPNIVSPAPLVKKGAARARGFNAGCAAGK